MKLIIKLMAIVLTCTTMQGCANNAGGGAMLGGIGGAVAGSAFGKGDGRMIASALGAVAGAAAGAQISQTMTGYKKLADARDQKAVDTSSQKALEAAPTGTNVEWTNPASGNHGYVTPTNTFQNSQGQTCREYTQMIFVGGNEEEVIGRACRQADGHWEIVK